VTNSGGSPRRRQRGAPARRQQVLDCLARFGLTGRLARRADAEAPYVRRVRSALERLGPVFAAAGLYLSSRADLLPLADCVELSGIAERPPPTPATSVRPVLISELGRPLGEVFSAFEEAPWDCGFQTQSHHAWLRDERPVVVKLVRPEWGAHWAGDGDLLPLLAEALAAGPWDGLSADEWLDDFRQCVPHRMDLGREAEALTALADDPAADGVRVPAVLRPLSTAGVLVYERPAGVRLSELLAGGPGTGRGAYAGRAAARQLVRVWLRLALRGGRFPADLRPADVVLLTDDTLALTGGRFADLPAEPRAGLTGHLTAAAAGDLDAACAHLLGELKPTPGSAGADAVRRALRQAVLPHEQDGAPALFGDGPAESLFAHLACARAQGWRPTPAVAAFAQGLARVGALARGLAPDGAGFREALEGFRVEAVLSRLRDVLGLRGMSGRWAEYGALCAEFPQLLDRLLSPAADPGRPYGQPAPCVRERAPALRVWFVACVLALAGLALSTDYPQAPAPARASGRFAALMTLLSGGLLLREAARAG
jgi:ubiquinone biosynthesis protein